MTDLTAKLDLLEGLITTAKSLGADAADAVFVEGQSMSVSYRLGETENVSRSEGSDIGLRVLIGQRQAIVSSSDDSGEALRELAERAVAMARVVPEDKYCGLADPSQLARDVVDLDMCDTTEFDAETLTEWAKRAEDAARAVKGVTNSEGADAGWGRSGAAVVASNGFARTYERSHYSLSASTLAGEGTNMERDYDYSSTVYAADLADPETIGRSAGERTVKRLNPRKVATQQVPVIYDPRVSRSIVGHLSSAINGSGIARGTSFLKDKMGEQVFSDGIRIIDDPLRIRGLRSAAFDDEGLPTTRINVIEVGRLTSWFLDLATARQLGLESTGHASRGVSSPPHPSASNLYMEAGQMSVEDMIKDIDNGFFITELIGMGVSGVTGDYSRGAGGFWIENGEIAYPVSEVTVAGNLKEMFKNLTPASDLEFRYGTDAPSLRIDGMTVAGN